MVLKSNLFLHPKLGFWLPPTSQSWHHPPFSFAKQASFHQPPSCTCFLSSLRASSQHTHTTTLAFPHPLDPHGPSLHRGRSLNMLEAPELHPDHLGLQPSLPGFQATSQPLAPVEKRLDKLKFARVYDLAALRVPAEECAMLANRLAGHLLNWPHVKNVARVAGDDMDDNLKGVLWESRIKTASTTESLRNAVYGVRESMSVAEKFNSEGSLQFPSIERISRPKSRRKPGSAGDRKGDIKEPSACKNSRRQSYTIEVADELDAGQECRGESLSDLLGGSMGRREWIGATRLLLLDERYAGKPVSGLPMAVQAALHESQQRIGKPRRQTVQCKLTLFYDYWPMDEILRNLLPREIGVPTAFETVGHIAHLNLREEHLPYRHLIAQVVLDKHKPHIQTVVNKMESIESQYRTMQLEVLAGNHSLVTTVIEHGIKLHVDLAKVYWSSRLATERQRLIQSFCSTDVLCDVFAGVGPLSVAAAKKVKRVYANDLNPSALQYLAKNISENKLQAKFELFNLDGHEFIRKILAFDKPVLMTQVVMNLPTDAVEFLDAFRGAFNKDTWDAKLPMPTIHVYGFSKASEPEADFNERIIHTIGVAPEHIDLHRVRLVAPGKWMICATFQLPQQIAFK